MELFNLAKELLENDIDCHVSYYVIEGKPKKFFVDVGTSQYSYLRERISESQWEELYKLIHAKTVKTEEQKRSMILSILNKKLGK